MEDKPLLHPCDLDYLVLEYLFGDCHWVSFPKRNPTKKTLKISVTKVRNSTIAFFLVSNCPNYFNIVVNYFVVNVD